MLSNSERVSERRAIVLGGSIAGLLSARVLSDYFDQVTIIDSDQFSSTPCRRIGVPQSMQPHILFVKGYQILRKLYPTIEHELISNGGLKINWATDFHLFLNGKWLTQAQGDSGLISFTCSRPLLEWVIRRLTLSISNIKLLERHRAKGLLTDSRTDIVTGVEVSANGKPAIELMSANLVVDASGRTSKMPQWLQSAGFQVPTETVIDPLLGYATRLYKKPKDIQFDWQVMSISHTPPHNPRRGYLADIEDGQWIATLGGFGGDFPPNEDRGFLEFCKSLSSDQFYQSIKEAEPASDIFLHRASANRLRHYEKIRLPKNLIALGDSVCSLCPVYGQGMTVSAEASLVLRDWVEQYYRQGFDGNKFQKKLAKSNAFAWMLATSQDSRFPSTKNRIIPSRAGQIIAKYNERLIEKASDSPRLYTLFLEVAHHLKSPLALLNPRVACQVYR